VGGSAGYLVYGGPVQQGWLNGVRCRAVDKFEKELVTVIGRKILRRQGEDDGSKDRAQKEKSEARPLLN
jgi:hypothetical protein